MGRKGESIFKRKDGRFEARYVKDYKNDVPNYGYIYGKSYSEVKEKRRLITIEIEKKKINYANKEKFNYYIYKWLEGKKDKIKKSSYATYLNKVKKHLLPDLGECQVNIINREFIEEYLKNKAIFLETNTVHELGMILKQIIKENTLNIDFDIPIKKKKPIEVFQSEEIKRLENNTLISDNPYILGIGLSLYTGIRIGELCALKKENFDLDNQLIYINHTLIRVNSDNYSTKTQVILDDPKTANSNRVVPIANKLLVPLKEYLAKIPNDNYYFLTNSYHYMEPRSYYNKYLYYLKKWGIKKHKFHTLRHTFATNAIEKNMDVKALAEVLGHSNVSITLNLYVHPSINYKRECIDKIYN
ncbi:MAG: tyrosine-type recombinase/integrase [bacterium]|nr:tyrosine-type recombinase/integrase [bacterium]